MSNSMTSTSAAVDSLSAGWIRSLRFDMVLIVGVALLALVSGWVVVGWPHLFPIVLLLDLWLLGYPHVVSTFMRITLDKESFAEHRFLILVLPWIVLAGTVVIGLTLGFWALATTYLYWQWFHYTRQSYGILRIYSRKIPGFTPTDGRVAAWSLYLLPLWGILHRSFQAQPTFLGMPVRYLPTPGFVAAAAGIAACAALVVWLVYQALLWRQGRLPLALNLYLVSHFAVFYVGYIAIKDITHGWLVLNVWHNAQYVLIVWLYNNQRFKGGVTSSPRFLSWISQDRLYNVSVYVLVCLLTTFLLYGAIENLTRFEFLAAIPLVTVVIYQAINFHHYVVDGVIWKVRKKKMRTVLGLK